MTKDFYQRVYRVVQAIPRSRVTSYGAIARFLGAGRSARLVGTALKQSPDLLSLPAHRVLNRSGQLTGRHAFHPPELMEELLRDEGFTIRDSQVEEFQTYFWDPSQNLIPENY